MLQLFTAAIFVSAALLFLVQPLTGKLLLPLLGGSPSVWNTCMVFFQAVLLVGYFYSHVIGKLRNIAAQAAIHVVVLIAAGLTLPIATREGTLIPQSAPSWWLIETLLRTVGLPFFVVATTGPLVQRWFSRTDHP
ncbi:MAG: spermidine synthase, partial [bacterium]|nr:spermidine synthase [bacterium]